MEHGELKLLYKEKAAFLELERIAKEPCPLLIVDLELVEKERPQFWVAALRKKTIPMCIGELWLCKALGVEKPGDETQSLAQWLAKFILRRLYISDGAPLPNKRGGMINHSIIEAATWLLGREGFLRVSDPEEKTACKRLVKDLTEMAKLPTAHPHVASRHN